MFVITMMVFGWNFGWILSCCLHDLVVGDLVISSQGHSGALSICLRTFYCLKVVDMTNIFWKMSMRSFLQDSYQVVCSSGQEFSCG